MAYNFRFSPAGKLGKWAELENRITILIKAQNPAIGCSVFSSMASEINPYSFPLFTNHYKCELSPKYLVDVSVSDHSDNVHSGIITFCLPDFLQEAKKMQFVHSNDSNVIYYKICSANSAGTLSFYNNDNNAQQKHFHLQGNPDDKIFVDTHESPCSYSQHLMVDDRYISIYDNIRNKYLGVKVVSVIEQRNVESGEVEILQVRFQYSEYNNQTTIEKFIELLSLITNDKMWFASKII